VADLLAASKKAFENAKSEPMLPPTTAFRFGGAPNSGALNWLRRTVTGGQELLTWPSLLLFFRALPETDLSIFQISRRVAATSAVVGPFAAGRTINPRIVLSQFHGGMIWSGEFEAHFVPKESAHSPAFVICHNEKHDNRASGEASKQSKRQHRTSHELREYDAQNFPGR
jgi:hypothetical protein